MAAKKKGASGGEGDSARGALSLTRDKAKASTKPVARVSQLKGIWDREFGVYRALIVEVLGRKGSRLTFRLIENALGWNSPKELTVNLDDGHIVWGDLPSTAQLVDLETRPRVKIGYLLLNENWLRENLGLDRQPEVRTTMAMAAHNGGVGGPGSDPPKIPSSGSL
jgi:hypothetical protein